MRNGFSWQSLLRSTVLDRYCAAQGSANIYARQWTDTMDLSVRIEAAVSDALIKNPLNEDAVKSFSKYRPGSNPSAAPINVADTAADGHNELAAQLRMIANLIRASAGPGATSVAAKLLNQEGILGVIAPEAHADLLVVDGDPTADITLLCEPDRALAGVMKAGVWEKPLRA